MSETFMALTSFIAGKIEDISDQDDLPAHDAWPHVAAEMMGYERDSVEFFTNNDGGIDFYYSNSPVYEIYQCKMHELDDAGGTDTDKPFDIEGVQDLERACTLIFGGESPSNVDPRILSLKVRVANELEQIPNDPITAEAERGISVIFNLVLLGTNIAPRAQTAINNFKKRLRELSNKTPGLDATFELLNLEELGAFFEDPSELQARKVEPIRLNLALRPGFNEPATARISSNDFITFYAPAIDLVSASIASGPSLFDGNVRYELKKSNINEEIRRSATHVKTMKLFHLYNNGVTIAADSWSYQNSGKSIQINGPSVINGCQTVRSLVAAQKSLAEGALDDPYKLRSFETDCMVMVRLIKKSAVDVEAVVQAANTQNSMEPRNLLSNRTEQRQIERELNDLGWFYERKDGSKDALIEAKKSSLNVPIRVYQPHRRGQGQRIIRTCDNRDLSRAWLSYIGFSDEGQNQRKIHFLDTSGGLYRKIFHSHPNDHWSVVSMRGEADPLEHMNEGRAPTRWMLFAHHLFRTVKYVLPSASRLRSEIRKQIAATGSQPTIARINQTIMGNDENRLLFALSMLDHVMVELVGFCFARSLEGEWLAPTPATKALGTGVIGNLHLGGQIPANINQGGILRITKDQLANDPALLAIRLAARGIQGTLSKPEFQDSFIASERKSRYLQQDQLLREYARTVDQYDKYLGDPGNFEEWWDGGSPYKSIRQSLMAN